VDTEDRGDDRATAVSTGSWLLRAAPAAYTERVSLDMADVVRDELTILREEIVEQLTIGAFFADRRETSPPGSRQTP
jgi:hypothetical protein